MEHICNQSVDRPASVRASPDILPLTKHRIVSDRWNKIIDSIIPAPKLKINLNRGSRQNIKGLT